MVVIHIKNSDENQFLFETTVKESVDTLIRQVVKVWNMRLEIKAIAYQCERLGEFGPSKAPDKQGIDEVG